MESTISKIATFYKVLDAVGRRRGLTKDAVDDALGWGRYVQNFLQICKTKPFFPKLRSVVDRRLKARRSRPSSLQPPLEALERGVNLIATAMLKNPHLSKDSFAHVLSRRDREDEGDFVERLAETAARVAAFEERRGRGLDSRSVETRMMAEALIRFVVDAGGGGRPRENVSNATCTALNEIVEEEGGLAFVVDVLFVVNAEDFTLPWVSGEELGDAVDVATDVVAAWLARVLLDEFEDVGGAEAVSTLPLGRLGWLCGRDTRIFTLYLNFLERRKSKGFEEDTKLRVESLAETFADDEAAMKKIESLI